MEGEGVCGWRRGGVWEVCKRGWGVWMEGVWDVCECVGGGG